MQLKDYIQGKKQGREANRLEREAMNDPFLQEALDGFDKVAGNHAKIINRLEKRFTLPSVSTLLRRNMLLNISIAASILLLIGLFGAYLLLEKNRQNASMLAEAQFTEDESGILFDSPVSQSIQEEKFHQEPLIAECAKPKAIPAMKSSSTVSARDESSPVADDMAVVETIDVTETYNLSAPSEVYAEAEYSAKSLNKEKERKRETIQSDSIQHPFGEKEFQTYCQQKADKNVCAGKGATVKVSFFIDETGKPAIIDFKSYSCEDAKKEIGNLLSSSPAWTKTDRKVTMTIKW